MKNEEKMGKGATLAEGDVRPHFGDGRQKNF